DHSTAADPGETIEDDQRTSAIRRRIVEIRYGGSREMTEHTRIIWLPLPVIASCDDGGRNRIQCARPDTALAFIEVAWVLTKNRRINRSAQQSAGHVIRKCSTISLSVSFYSSTISWKDVVILLRTCHCCHTQERNRINDGTNPELKLLLRFHRRCVPVIAAVEIWDNPTDALLHCDMQLLFSQFRLVSRYGHASSHFRDR